MKDRKRITLIYNPTAGKGSIRFSLSNVINALTKGGYDVLVHPTQSRYDAKEFARERAGEADIVVCSGGDGTLCEVATGVYLSGAKVPIGYIPSGSTNDYAASIGLPKSAEEAAKCIVNGKLHGFDLGQFNDSNFIYVAAFGWFTDVSYATDQNLKNVLGHGAYVLEAGKRLFKMPVYNIKVRTDEMDVEESIVYGMISNTRSVGGMKEFAWREVDMDDGLFEVTLVHNPTNLLELSEAATSLLSGEPSRLIHRFKTRRVEISSDEAISWTLDGEQAGDYRDVKIENIQNAITLIVRKKQ